MATFLAEVTEAPHQRLVFATPCKVWAGVEPASVFLATETIGSKAWEAQVAM